VLFTLCFSISPRVAQADITTGLVGYWSLNDGSGTTVLDTSGSNKNATLHANTTWVSGKFGNAIDFSTATSTGQSMWVNNFTGTTTFTYSLWVKHAAVADVTDDGGQYIIGQQTSGANPCVRLASSYYIDFGGAKKVIFTSIIGGTVTYDWDYFASSTDWTLFTVTNDPTNNVFNLYINGSKIGTSGAFGCNTAFENVLVVGMHPSIVASRVWNGAVDDVRFYNRALTESDVQELYTWAPADLPPEINISSPLDGSTASTTRYISVTADATDDSGVYSVQFQIDGVNFGSADLTAPYSTQIDTFSLSNGPHTISAIALDDSLENYATSTITINIDNPESNFYVTTTGSSANVGSLDSPWDLDTAFQMIDRLGPGDTVWIRGGTYDGPFLITVGTSSVATDPIIFRNYNNERAILDYVQDSDFSRPGAWSTPGSTLFQNVWLWGLEMMDSDKEHLDGPGDINGVFGEGGIGTKLINSFVHDIAGIGPNVGEDYGNIMYYVGRNAREHGLYWSNIGEHLRYAEDNIIGNVSGIGMQLYGNNTRGFRITGNSVWNSGDIIAEQNKDILIGGGGRVGDAIFSNNYTFSSTAHNFAEGFYLGYGSPSNDDIILKNNYMVNTWPVLFQGDWETVNFTNNIVFTRWYQTFRRLVAWTGAGPYDIDNNNYYFENPLSTGNFENVDGHYINFTNWKVETGFDTNSTSNIGIYPPDRVYVRPNKYESGRGNVIVYNWSDASSVDVNLSSILNIGDTYEIRKAENYLTPLVTGATYNGGDVSFTMTDTTVPTPVGDFLTASSTFPEFGAFVVIRTATSTIDLTAPILSNGGPSGDLASDTSTTTLSLTTNENSLCLYSTTTDTAFLDMHGWFDTTGTTTHSVEIDGLENNESYNYYVRCRNLSDKANTNDYTISFSVDSVVSPTIITSVASLLSTTAATLNGSIENTGNGNALEHGFAYGTVANLSTVIATSTLGAKSGTGAFSENLTGLTPNTTYYVRAYATNSVGTGYGTIETFTTDVATSTVVTAASSSLSTTAATLNGSISATGGEDATQHGFAWGTSATLASAATTTGGAFAGTGNITSSLSSLTCATTYYARAYATNSAGTGYGDIVSFQTSACPVTASSSGGGGSGSPAPLPVAPPGGFQVSVTPYETTDGKITLNLTGGSDITKVAIADNPSFETASYVTYNSTYTYSVGGVPGKKTLYIKFCNRYGRCSEPQSLTVKYSPPEGEPSSFTDRVTGAVGNIIPSFLKPKPKTPTPAVLEPVIPRVDLTGVPEEILTLSEKFPGLRRAIEKLAAEGGDIIEKLTSARLTIPTLSRGISFSSLGRAEKRELPTDVVFAKSGELIDHEISLEVADDGEALQVIHTLAGKRIDLAVKPEFPVEEITGYLMIKNIKRQQAKAIPASSLMVAPIAALLASEHEDVEEIKPERKLVLSSFIYADGDKDGIYTASVKALLVHGEYDIMTIVRYKDVKLGAKELHLIAVVDPEGYVYYKVRKDEARISDAKVSLLWKDSKTKTFSIWPATDFKQTNPQTTDKTGNYSFLVPEGTYKLTVSAPNYYNYTSSEFTVTQGAGVHENVELVKRHWWRTLWRFFTGK